MSRLFSLLVLLAVLAAVGIVFYQVMAGFFVPLFLAVLLVVMFRPVHQWIMDRCGGRGHWAAGLTTATILIAVLVPLTVVMVQASREGLRIARDLGAVGDLAKQPGTPDKPIQSADATPTAAETKPANPPVEGTAHGGSNGVTATEAKETNVPMRNLVARTVEQLGLPILPEEQKHIADSIRTRIEAVAQPLLVGGAQIAGKTLLGLIVMIVSIYFFLLDGPSMLAWLADMIPLQPAHTQELVSRFVNVSRAIVTATLLSAVIQGILAGVAYRIAGLDSVFLLMSLTMLLAMIPFVGAVSVWLPCCLWLFFAHENTVAAIGLAIFGTAIISQADNVIKPYVLHGQSNLHPLLALLSVLGGVQALGPIGIVVGPMAVAFLQTLLNMVRAEIRRIDAVASEPEHRPPDETPTKSKPGRIPPLPALRPALRRIRMMMSRGAK